MKIFNNKKLKIVRKLLRNNMTDAEKRLWLYLKSEQLGVKFRRQHSIGNYIVDFYCPTKILIIEIDGDSHFQNNKTKDIIRDKYLSDLGVTVLRFTNSDIYYNIDEVIEKITNLVITPPKPPLTKRRNEK